MRLASLIWQEWRAIFSDGAVLLTVFGGVLLYSFLYPLPYRHQTPRELPLAVVDLDPGQLSRRLQFLTDASPHVRLARSAANLAEAEELLTREGLAGILVIPENFHSDLLAGRRPTLTLAGDARFFLVYGKAVEGMSGAAAALGAELSMQPRPGGKAANPPPQLAVGLNLSPVFNPGMGYLTYVIPAVFLLILHQTLLIGIGLISAGPWGQSPPTAPGAGGAVLARGLVRLLSFVAIYWLLAMYLLGLCFDFYQIPRLAEAGELLLALLPFLLGAAVLGLCLGLLLPRRELVVLVVLLSSMPLIFLAGFIWPMEAIPAPLRLVGWAVPVIPGIRAFLLLNHFGADFPAIALPWATLWLQTAVYGSLAWYLLARKAKTTTPPESQAFQGRVD